MKPTAPGSLSHIFALRSTFPLHLFSDLLNQKHKNTLLQFFLIYFIWRSIYQFTTNLSHICLPILRRRTPKGIDNPFNTSGCEYLLFVCRCLLRGGLITEGYTYRRYTASSLPLWGNTDVVLADIKRNFWRR